MMAADDKVAIVTGANSGIGLETTRRLSEAGYDVILACRSEERAQQAIDKLLAENSQAKLSYRKVQ